MTMPDPEEKIFSLSDLRWLYQKKKRILFGFALIGCLISFGYVYINPPVYRAEATFKEGVEQRESQSALLEVMASMRLSSDAPQAGALMQSCQVLQPLIRHMGLQAKIAESRPLFHRMWQRFFNIMRAEFGCPLADLDPFRFSDVGYDGEKPLKLSLIFIDRDHFEVIQEQKSIPGRVNEKIKGENFYFTMSQTPKNLRTKIKYRLTIVPWISVVKQLRKNLQIISHKSNKSIYDLSLKERDRFLGTELLNQLMREYQKYLKQDHDQVTQMQITYLEERQNALIDKLGRDYDEHVRYLQKNVDDKGFIRAAQEGAALLKSYRELFSKSFAADLEMDHLSASFDRSSHVLTDSKSPIRLTIQHLRDLVQELEGQRDLLVSSLYFHPAMKETAVGDAVSQYKEELQKVRQDLHLTKCALEEIESKNVLSVSMELFHDPDHAIQSWAHHLDLSSDESKDFVAYLRNLIHLFSVREKILMERQFPPQNQNQELNGIDLTTAKQLIIQTSQNLDGSKAAIQHYRHLLNRTDDPSFALSSLSAVLKDPVSQRTCAAATDLHLQMEDESHHSEKEVSRIKSEAMLQRKILKEHLQQMIVVEQLNSSIYQDKIISLQQMSLDCISRQISVANEQIASLINERKESLIREKEILANKMQELRDQMNQLPEKLRAENLLKLKTELGIKIMQSVAQLVESKTIGHNLHHVESKPLDLAIVPFLPEKPYLFFSLFVGAAMGWFISFLGMFFKTLYRGFPLSSCTMQALKYPYAGSISSHIDAANIDHLPNSDLESLRQLLLKIDTAPHAKLIGLFAGQGPNYAHALARLMTQSGRKVLLLECDFSTKASFSETPGLQQALHEECRELPIRPCAGYDLMLSGGCTRFGMEMLRSDACKNLLQKLALSYDHILLLNRSPLESAECAALLALSQKAVVTIVEESIELLTPFIRWAYDEERSRLTFLTASYSL